MTVPQKGLGCMLVFPGFGFLIYTAGKSSCPTQCQVMRDLQNVMPGLSRHLHLREPDKERRLSGS